VIDRFPGDIDLPIPPAFVGADISVFTAMKSRTRRDAALARMQARCGERTRGVWMPRRERSIVEHLGRPSVGSSSLRYEDGTVVRSQVVPFECPTAPDAGLEYLRREMKFELGLVTNPRPTEQQTVRLWVVDGFPSAFPIGSAR